MYIYQFLRERKIIHVIISYVIVARSRQRSPISQGKRRHKIREEAIREQKSPLPQDEASIIGKERVSLCLNAQTNTLVTEIKGNTNHLCEKWGSHQREVEPCRQCQCSHPRFSYSHDHKFLFVITLLIHNSQKITFTKCAPYDLRGLTLLNPPYHVRSRPILKLPNL